MICNNSIDTNNNDNNNDNDNDTNNDNHNDNHNDNRNVICMYIYMDTHVVCVDMCP